MMISKNFKFEAAHHLRNYEGQCKNPHGHSYHGTIWIDGPINEIGFVMDYADIKYTTDYFDHKDLNELPEFKDVNPTAENIVKVISMKLYNKLTGEHDIAIELHETESSSVFWSTPRLNFLAR